jgi:tetratricopeptide (TPR) repeat protein
MPKGDSETALEALRTSIRLRIAILGEDHIAVGTSWNNVGCVYFQQANYDSATDAYRRALRIRRNEQGDSVDVAATLFNIGQVFPQGDNDRALRHYQEFLKLAKKHFRDYHRDICIVTTCIGQVLHEHWLRNNTNQTTIAPTPKPTSPTPTAYTVTSAPTAPTAPAIPDSTRHSNKNSAHGPKSAQCNST